MKFNNYKNHISKFIAENENNRFTKLKTEETYILWKDTVTNKHYIQVKSDSPDFSLWCELELVATMKKTVYDSLIDNPNKEQEAFVDLITDKYCTSSVLEKTGEVIYEWYRVKHSEHAYAYVSCISNNEKCKKNQVLNINEFYLKIFPHIFAFDGYIEDNSVYRKNLKDRVGYKTVCDELAKHPDSVLIVSDLSVFDADIVTLSEEFDRLKEMGIRVVTTDGYFDSISPSSFDVIERKRNHNLPPHAVMLHRIKMAQYKALGKPQGFVLEDVE